MTVVPQSQHPTGREHWQRLQARRGTPRASLSSPNGTFAIGSESVNTDPTPGVLSSREVPAHCPREIPADRQTKTLRRPWPSALGAARAGRTARTRAPRRPPEFRGRSRQRRAAPSRQQLSTVIVTLPPASVNLSEFVSRFRRICWTRSRSAKTVRSSSRTLTLSKIPFAAAWTEHSSVAWTPASIDAERADSQGDSAICSETGDRQDVVHQVQENSRSHA